MTDDQRRYARVRGVTLVRPEGHPLRTVDALRALLAAGEPFLPLAHRFFRAYWVDGVDISRAENVRKLLVEHGLDADRILERAASEEIKTELRKRTDEAVARGVFGAPSFFVGEELFFGQDRMEEVEAALGGTPARFLRAPDQKMIATDFWFDYSSPFSYLASERVEAELGESARWRPMLLGGLFKMLGGPDVPLFTQSDSKRRHTARDLQRQADRSRAKFSWPSKFPMNTVLALRVTLLASSHRALVHRIFRAYWAEDRDISDPALLRSLADEVGLDGAALVERAPEAKDALRRETEAAAAAGVFGAPTFVVHFDGGEPGVYWGADRLELAARAAAGDLQLR